MSGLYYVGGSMVLGALLCRWRYCVEELLCRGSYCVWALFYLGPYCVWGAIVFGTLFCRGALVLEGTIVWDSCVLALVWVRLCRVAIMSEALFCWGAL